MKVRDSDLAKFGTNAERSTNLWAYAQRRPAPYEQTTETKIAKHSNDVKRQKRVTPIVTTVKKDKSVKLALDLKILNKAIHKNKYQMPNIDSLIDAISQHINDSKHGENVYFSTIDLKYAYSQLNLHPDTARHCNFKIIRGDATGTYRFKTGFY